MQQVALLIIDPQNDFCDAGGAPSAAGEALNFCVANTVLDIFAHIGDADIQKFVFMENATSPAPGPDFAHLTESFLTTLKDRGARFSAASDFLS